MNPFSVYSVFDTFTAQYIRRNPRLPQITFRHLSFLPCPPTRLHSWPTELHKSTVMHMDEGRVSHIGDPQCAFDSSRHPSISSGSTLTLTRSVIRFIGHWFRHSLAGLRVRQNQLRSYYRQKVVFGLETGSIYNACCA